MILLDSDVMIDLLRQYPPATEWFDGLDDEEELLLPGYIVMELIQGCRNKVEQERLRRELATYGIVWPAPADCIVMKPSTFSQSTTSVTMLGYLMCSSVKQR